MTPKRNKSQLVGSWVGESDEGSDYSPSRDVVEERQQPPPRRTTPPRRGTRGARSPDPEFVMPPLDSDTMEATWAESSSRSASSRNGGAILPCENRRRTSKQPDYSGSPEKRIISRTSHNKYGSRQMSQLAREPSHLEEVLKALVDKSGTILGHVLDVFGSAFRILKTPISYILAIYLLFGFVVVLRTLVTNSVYASLSPVCRIPGASLLNLPFCPAYKTDSRHGPPLSEFDELMNVQAKFEEVLEESAGNTGLPMDMKRGEASIRDLRQLVKYSALQSKNELVLEFDGFIETARIASYDLQKFNSHVGRAVDSVIATTRWTARVLGGIEERDAARGRLEMFVNDKLLAPFQAVKVTESLLLDQYIQHTRLVEEELFKLISEAQALLGILTNLDDRLDVIYGITTRDDNQANAVKDEVLSQLWSLVGGNQKKLKKMDRQISLLQQVGVYRKNAMLHVTEAILKLQEIGTGLEDLRERVGAPELLRDRTEIPLSVHIENIQLGVARLEERRLSSRKVENEELWKTLEQEKADGSLLDRS
ncbi:hypothetical protein BJ878DRAFT_412671 [Calycina marina]|uniref:Uncharacterized protein n=1 Tax=Calycina marina TaxID=1763456 RepID=A0A9P8CJ38_9HELO|nr:hypothetical protein BJ878DRAFT_412671 [Calycina marina]